MCARIARASGDLGSMVQAQLARFQLDVRAAREIRDQDAALVADSLGLDVLVGARVFLDRVDVHAALVRERALADVRLLRPGRAVRELVHAERHVAQAR